MLLTKPVSAGGTEGPEFSVAVLATALRPSRGSAAAVIGSAAAVSGRARKAPGGSAEMSSECLLERPAAGR